MLCIIHNAAMSPVVIDLYSARLSREPGLVENTVHIQQLVFS